MPANTQISQPLLQVQNLEKRYPSASGTKQQTEVVALSDVSFSLTSKSTLAVVGESGSGKSTLALCIACLEKPTSGTIRFESDELTSLKRRFKKHLCRMIGYVLHKGVTDVTFHIPPVVNRQVGSAPALILWLVKLMCL